MKANTVLRIYPKYPVFSDAHEETPGFSPAKKKLQRTTNVFFIIDGISNFLSSLFCAAVCLAGVLYCTKANSVHQNGHYSPDTFSKMLLEKEKRPISDATNTLLEEIVLKELHFHSAF